MRSGLKLLAIGTALFGAACGDSKPASSLVTNAASTPGATPITNSSPASSLSGAAANASANSGTENGMVVSGPIIVEHQLDLTAQRDGIVTKIYFDTPSRVKAGTLIAQLDDRQLDANLQAARAKSRSIAADLKNWQSEAEVLQADYVRAQRLWDLGLTSEEQLQHAKFKAESDQWDVKRVEETLNTAHSEERSLELEMEKTKVTAPFDLIVARRYVREGQTVGKGDRLFWVTNEAPLLLRFTLPERFYGRFKNGQDLEVHSVDFPGEKHSGRIKQLSPVIDPSSGTFEVLVELVGDRGSLRPGMTATVRIDNPR